MPITEEALLSKLVATGAISAMTVDTNIFDEKKMHFNSSPLRQIRTLGNRRFRFILSGTVADEVRSHLVKSIDDALRGARKAVGKALAAFDTKTPTLDDLIAQTAGEKTPEEAAARRFGEFLTDTNCDVIDDASLVSTKEIFEAYFAGKPPFGSGAKKNEFPDALALNGLEKTAHDRKTDFLVVSKDKDWISFCKASTRLHILPDLERALALINAPPVVLREAVQTWLDENNDGRADVTPYLEQALKVVNFDVFGHATHGEIEAIAWEATLDDINWPDLEEIDIIGSEDAGHGAIDVTISIPLTLLATVPVEVSFSIWDSVDKESISMGGRMIDHQEEFEVRATITGRVRDPGTEDVDIELLDCEIDGSFRDLDIGEQDMFEEGDFD